MNLACWAASKPDCWLTPPGLPHSPASAKALQLAAQTSTATVAATVVTSAQARLLTLAGLTAICIAHSIHSKGFADAVPYTLM